MDGCDTHAGTWRTVCHIIYKLSLRKVTSERQKSQYLCKFVMFLKIPTSIHSIPAVALGT